MSGASESRRVDGSYEFGPAWRDVALALIAMFSGVLLLQGDRIVKDCGCSQGKSLAIQWGAGAILAAFVVWLLWLTISAWRHGGRGFWCRLLAGEWHHVVAALVPWVTTTAGVLLLTVPSQTADMLSGLRGGSWSEIERPLIPFGIGALVWGLSTWFCGRWGIDIERRTSGRPESVLALWNPRLIALLTGFAIILVTVKAAGLCSRAVLVASGVAAFVILLAVLRRPLMRLFNPAFRSGGPAPRMVAHERGGTCWTTFRAGIHARWLEFIDDLRAAPGGTSVVLVALTLSVAVIGWYAFGPLLAGHVLRAPGTILLGIGCLTMLATVLSKFLLRLASFPILWVLVVATMVLSHWSIGVDHDIRTLPGPVAAAGPTLDQAAEQWLRTCGPNLAPPGTADLKVVLVSTAGGASRAALWTFSALAELQARDRQFPRRVFAISAVSGGALGATVWSALLAHDGFDCRNTVPDGLDLTTRRATGEAILGHDFLAPALAVALSRDLLLAGIPLRPLGIKVEDRSAALEQAWEAAWADEFAGTDNLLAGDFLRLWNGTFDRPLLLLNGTVEQTGQPIVTAPIAIVDQHGGASAELPATYDARWLLHEEIRTSTAVLNAARFPVITSQGDISVRRCPDGSIYASGLCDLKDASDDVLSVVDGGYFDNIGAGTTIRAAAALTRAFHELRDQDHMFAGVALRILVVGINSDPDRFIPAAARHWLDPKGVSNAAINPPVDQLMRCGQQPSTLLVNAQGMDNMMNNEIAPFLAIAATQSGHTALRMAELNQQFCSVPRDLTAASNYIMLSLCPIGDDRGSVSLPLNWTLSRATRELFVEKSRWHLATECGNRDELATFAAWVAP